MPSKTRNLDQLKSLKNNPQAVRSFLQQRLEESDEHTGYYNCPFCSKHKLWIGDTSWQCHTGGCHENRKGDLIGLLMECGWLKEAANGLHAPRVRKQQQKPVKKDYVVEYKTLEGCIEGYLKCKAEDDETGKIDPTKHTLYKYDDDRYRIRLFNKDGTKHSVVPIQRQASGKWAVKLVKNDKWGLYGRQKLANASESMIQLVVEGEKKADIVNRLSNETFNYIGICSAGGAYSSLKSDWSGIREDLPLLLWPDPEKAGGQYLLGVLKALLDLRKWPKMVYVIGGKDPTPIDDLIQNEANEEKQRKLILEYADAHGVQLSRESAIGRVVGVDAEKEAMPDDNEFLLETADGTGLVASCKLTLISGNGGSGKSLLLKNLVKAIIDGEPTLGPLTINQKFLEGTVFYFSKDEAGATPKSHVKQIGGRNLDRVVTADCSTLGEVYDKVKQYSRYCEAGKISLIVIDTGVDYLDAKQNSNSDGDVKSALNNLVTLAKSLGAAVILTGHWNRTKGRLEDRINGSTAWINKVRQVSLLAKDPAAKTRSILCIGKSNVGVQYKPVLNMNVVPRGKGELPSIDLSPNSSEYAELEQQIVDCESVLMRGGGRESNWSDESILSWTLKTVGESEGKTISAGDLEKKQREAGLPRNRYESSRADLISNGQLAYRQEGARRLYFIPARPEAEPPPPAGGLRPSA